MARPGSHDPRVDLSDDIRELTELFLAKRREDLARLEAALAAGDLETVRAVGHVFKGSSEPFGYPEAGHLGAEIEEAAKRGDRPAVEALVPRLKAALPPQDGRDG